MKTKVEECHVALVDGSGVDLQAGVEGLVHNLAGQHMLQGGTHERRALAGLDVLKLGHGPELPLEIEDQPILQLIR